MSMPQVGAYLILHLGAFLCALCAGAHCRTWLYPSVSLLLSNELLDVYTMRSTVRKEAG